ncbi:MAG TPA: hypothetical protein VKI44_17080 [Acetobacteraceae bacterium]|nr:hypothetical protein [Acetobacteraceae bacterium]
MQVCEEFKVSDVAPRRTEAPRYHQGHGFAITNSHGGSLLSIMYRSHDEAIEAREAIVAALAKAIVVVT